MRFEHAMLFLGAQTCEQRHDLDGVRPAHVGGTRAEMMAERLLEVADVALAGGEHENVTWSLVMRGENRQFGACASDRGGHVHCLGVRVRDVVAGRSVRKPGNMPHQRGSASQRLIADRDRVRAAGDLDYRYLGAQCVFEMLLELRRIDCRGGDDELQVATQRQQGGEIAEQEVYVETAFVRLVDDDRVIACQFRIALDLREQNAVGDHAQACLRRAFVGEPHLVANFVAQAHAHLVGEAFGHGARGETAWLLAMRAATEFEQDLRQLRGLAGTGLPGDDHHLTGTHRVGDGFACGRDRQLIGVFEFHNVFLKIIGVQVLRCARRAYARQSPGSPSNWRICPLRSRRRDARQARG